MMGYSHAVTGMAGWLALTSTSGAALSIYQPGPGAVVLAGSLLCAGAAMAPDADHEQASIAHSLPPVTKLLASGIETISGGHRHGTHSFVGIAAFTLLAYAMSSWMMEINGRTVSFGSGLLAVILVAFATQSLGLHKSLASGTVGDILSSKIGPWVIALGTAGAVTYFLDYRWAWLPICMALGTYIHVLGDSLTVQGVPWLWPWFPKPPAWVRNTPILKEFWTDNGYFRIPLLGKTGGNNPEKKRGRKKRKTSWQETIFIYAVSIYVIYLLAYEVLALWGQRNVLF